MKNKRIPFDQMNIELLNDKELIETVGGRTSFAYDVGTFLRICLQSRVHPVLATTTAVNWYLHQ